MLAAGSWVWFSVWPRGLAGRTHRSDPESSLDASPQLAPRSGHGGALEACLETPPEATAHQCRHRQREMSPEPGSGAEVLMCSRAHTVPTGSKDEHQGIRLTVSPTSSHPHLPCPRRHLPALLLPLQALGRFPNKTRLLTPRTLR